MPALDLPDLLGLIFSIEFRHDLLMWCLPVPFLMQSIYFALCKFSYHRFRSMSRLERFVNILGRAAVMERFGGHIGASFEAKGYRCRRDRHADHANLLLLGMMLSKSEIVEGNLYRESG